MCKIYVSIGSVCNVHLKEQTSERSDAHKANRKAKFHFVLDYKTVRKTTKTALGNHDALFEFHLKRHSILEERKRRVENENTDINDCDISTIERLE